MAVRLSRLLPAVLIAYFLVYFSPKLSKPAPRVKFGFFSRAERGEELRASPRVEMIRQQSVANTTRNNSVVAGAKKYIVKQSVVRAVRQQTRSIRCRANTPNVTSPLCLTRVQTPKIRYSIRPLELRDVGACFHLGERVFSETSFNNLYRTWDEFEVVSLINSHPEFCFIAETEEAKGGEMVRVLAGFALGSVLMKNNGKSCIGYLDWVVVEPRFQCQGIGTSLTRRVIDGMKAEYNIKVLIADTPARNMPAINFFISRIGLTEKVPHVYMSREVKTQPEEPRGKVAPIVRMLSVDDLHLVHSLGEELFARFPNLIRNWDQHTIMAQFQTDREFSLVAEINGSLAGFALGTFIEKPLQKKKFGHLTWLGVDPKFARMGIGRRLVYEFERLVHNEGCQQLLVDTEEDNLAAIALFNKLNFSHKEKHVYFSTAISRTGPMLNSTLPASPSLAFSSADLDGAI